MPEELLEDGDTDACPEHNHEKIRQLLTHHLVDCYLSADPAEKKNLAGENPALAAKLRKTLDEWRKSTRESLAGADYRN